MADYVILQATEPVTQNSMWKALRPQQHHTLFEERHLRYMKPLGKVRVKHQDHISIHCP